MNDKNHFNGRGVVPINVYPEVIGNPDSNWVIRVAGTITFLSPEDAAAIGRVLLFGNNRDDNDAQPGS